MKTITLFIIAAILGMTSFTASANQSVAKALSAFAWEKRQILVFAPNEQDTEYQAFVAAVNAQSAGMIDRRLQVWHLVANHPLKLGDDVLQTKLAVSAFQSAYGVAADEFRVILIGYDQGEKLRQEAADLERIFAEVDQMPMRLQEMRRKATTTAQ